MSVVGALQRTSYSPPPCVGTTTKDRVMVFPLYSSTSGPVWLIAQQACPGQAPQQTNCNLPYLLAQPRDHVELSAQHRTSRSFPLHWCNLLTWLTRSVSASLHRRYVQTPQQRILPQSLRTAVLAHNTGRATISPLPWYSLLTRPFSASLHSRHVISGLCDKGQCWTSCLRTIHTDHKLEFCGRITKYFNAVHLLSSCCHSCSRGRPPT